MVTNTTAVELVETGERRDRLGRRITPKARRAELIQAWKESGLTEAGFARREGIRYTTFCSWMQEPRVPRRVKNGKVRFAEVQLPTAASGALLEVRLADGTVVRGGQAAEVATLVRALRA